MVWGFVVCGPNEALVVSGESIVKSALNWEFSTFNSLNLIN